MNDVRLQVTSDRNTLALWAGGKVPLTLEDVALIVARLDQNLQLLGL